MGGSSSKRSSASDAGSNLLWSLEQLAAWEEKLSEDETFLTEQMSRSKSFGRSEMIQQDNPEFDKQRDREQFERQRIVDQPAPSSDIYQQQQNIPQETIQQQQVFEQRPPLIRVEEQRAFLGQPEAQFQSRPNIPEGDRTIVTTAIQHEPISTFSSNVATDSSFVAPSTAATTNIPETRYERSESIPTKGAFAADTVARDALPTQSAFSTTTTSGEARPQSEYARSTDSYSTGAAGTYASSSAYPTDANWEAKNISPSGKIRIPLLQGAQDTYVAPSTTRKDSSFAPSFLKTNENTTGIVSDAGATTGITGTGLGASTAATDNVQFDEELFLPQKFHFAYQALQSLVAGAERNFRLTCRSNLLRQRASNQSQPLLKLADEKKLESVGGLLNAGLVSWDNAVAAVEWLQKDYDLGLRWVKLSRQLRVIQAERESLFTARSNIGTNLTEEEARKARYAADNQIRSKSDSLMSQINDVRKRLTDIMRDIANHQRDSLSIGLMFLDKNMSGAIEPEDIPNLHSDLFAALDISGKHKITTAHLQGTVDKMLNDVVSIERQLKDLEVSIARDKEEEQQRLMQVQGASSKDSNNLQKFQANLLSKQEQYSFLYSELQRKRRILDRLYQVFGQSFIRQVLKKLDTPADEVVERVHQLMVSKRQEERGVPSNFAVNRQWQPPVDV